jgi:hypothetical protein
MVRKSLLLTSVGMMVASVGVAWAQAPAPIGGYPADAQPGQCFARVIVPEVASSVDEQVIVQAARTEVRVIPARYELVDEQVLTREASVEYRVVPATYRTVTESVVVEPARTETIAAPASTETYTERVMVRPAYTTWKPGRNILGRAGGVGSGAATVASTGDATDVHTGELLCRIEVPAEYTTITRTRAAETASAQTRTIPARTEQVTRQVVATAARVEERPIPAEYRTIKVRRLVEAARTETIQIPATYRTVTRRVVQSAGGVEWREVLCETNTTPVRVREIQTALNSRGFTTSVDGVFGPATISAMERFQRTNGLPVGYMTVETVRALGLGSSLTPR